MVCQRLDADTDPADTRCFRRVSRAGTLSAAAALAVPFSTCSSTAEASKAGTFYGSELAFGNRKVKTYVVTGNGGKPTELGFTLTPQRSSACPSRRMTPKLGLLLEAHRLQLRVERFAWQWRLRSLDG